MSEVPQTMHAVHLLGHGGFDMLEFRTDVPVPVPESNQVLVQVGACGVNNTDINTRIGWYSKTVTGATNDGGSDGYDDAVDDDGSWSGTPLTFPRIQGADAAGTIVAVGADVDASRIGERVMVRSMQNAGVDDPTMCETFGSEFDGGFAQFAVSDATEVFPINSELTDVELASFPCAYSTAEGMLHKVGLAEGERVLITGASGGVGSALIQLAARRGAHVTAVASQSKWPQLDGLGAEKLVDRNADLIAEFGNESFDVVADVVAGATFPSLIDLLVLQGRYVTSGAIAGPIVDLDVRSLYLKDLTLMGSTNQPRVVFENLIRYIEDGEIRPIVSQTYPLEDIAKAQQDFLDKTYPGKLVLIPASVSTHL